MALLGGAGEAIIGHEDRGGDIIGQRALDQRLRGKRRQRALAQHRADIRAAGAIGDLQCHLKRLTRGRQRVVEQQLLGVAIIAADRAHHHMRRQQTGADGVASGEIYARIARLGNGGGKGFAPRIEAREEITPAGDEAPRLDDRVIGGRATQACPHAGECRLLAAIGAIEPQQGLADPRKRGGDIADFRGGQVDIGEDRVAQQLGEAAGIIGAIVGCEVGKIKLVAARQPQQQVGGDRALVALDQRDIGGRDGEIIRHRLLGEPKFAAQALEARTHIERFGDGHARLCHNYTTLQEISVMFDKYTPYRLFHRPRGA